MNSEVDNFVQNTRGIYMRELESQRDAQQFGAT